MQTVPPSSVTDRLALTLQGLRRAIAAASGRNRALAPLFLVLWNYLGRAAARMAALAAKLRAGLPTTPRPSGARPSGPRPAHLLPRGHAWLIRLVPNAAPYGSQLQHLLSDPDMAAWLAASPQAGRILRPLCQMLGVLPDPATVAPSTPRRTASPPAPSEPNPLIAKSAACAFEPSVFPASA